jgi:hypothetical protein
MAADESKTNMGRNHLSYTGTYGNDAALLSKIFDISNATVHNIMPQINGGIKWVIMMEPFPALVDSFGEKNGGNSLGLSAETGDRIGKSCSLVYWHITHAANHSHPAIGAV